MEQLIAICRPGFETEAGRELTDSAASGEVYGYFEPSVNQGFLTFHCPGPGQVEMLVQRLSIDQLVFVRDWFVAVSYTHLTLPTIYSV